MDESVSVVSGVLRYEACIALGLQPRMIQMPKMVEVSGSPAFKDWSNRLGTGEKLPRGKYFAQQQLIRHIISNSVSEDVKQGHDRVLTFDVGHKSSGKTVPSNQLAW